MIKPSLFLLLSILTASSDWVWASETRWWKLSSQDDFAPGELKGVSITSDGRLVPAPGLAPLFDSGEAFIYSAVIDKAGTLYLGTGNNGRIFRVATNGTGAEYAKLSEAGVFALASDSLNRLYAATSPDGKVYRFRNSGESEIFFHPAEKYIWSLAIDAQNNLYIGTGPKGNIYKVDPQGQGSVLYDSGETHISVLKFDLDGNLLAGTAPGGLLLRVTPQGKPSVIFDSPLAEVKGLAVDRIGTIFAAALATVADPKAASPAQAPPGAGNSEEDGEATVKAEGVGAGKGLEVYRIGREGTVETLYSSDSESAFDLTVRGDGAVLVATGPKGRILLLSPDRFATYLVQSEEEQVTRLAEGGGRILAATSNLGKVYELQASPAQSGTYESPVLDAEGVAGWGTIRWTAVASDSSVRLYTRSGNTQVPDQTWEEWSSPYAQAGGSRVTSSAARFLQFKVEFPAQTGGSLTAPRQAVEEVAVSYLQNNAAPRIISLTVHPPGKAFAPLPVATAGGVPPGGPEGENLRSLPREIRGLEGNQQTPAPRPIYLPGARSFSWKAQDPNQDDLVYSVHIRRQGEDNWRPLKLETTRQYLSIDGAELEDGTYLAKVTASDRLSNPPGMALRSEMTSKAFVVANAGPALELSAPIVTGRGVSVQFTATARSAELHQAEYQIDGGDWLIAMPEDGITDSGTERYTFEVKDLGLGDHAISVRIIDAVGNVVARGATFRIR